jgi:hypothetical protein
MQSLSELVTSVFDSLNQSNVQYVVLRNYEKYPHEIGNDVDILLRPEDSDETRSIIRSVYHTLGFAIKDLPMGSNGFLLKAEGKNGVSLTIHFQYWVSLEFGWLHKHVRGLSYKVFLDALAVKEHANADVEFNVASDKDRFILLLRQWLFRKKSSYKHELLQLLQGDDVIELVADANLQRYADPIVLFETDETTTSVLKQLVHTHWSGQSQFRNYFKALRMTLKNMKNKILAPVIYVTGPDGAGKTSVSTIISAVLSDQGLSYKHVYSVKRNIIRHFIFAIRRKLSGKDDNKFSDAPSERKFRFIMTEDITDRDDGSFLWKLRKFTTLCISIFDVFINFIPVQYFRFKYNVVIVETSPYDIFIKYHMPEFRWLERILAPLFPKAKLGLLLRADADAIAERKHELTPDEINSYYDRLDILLARAGCLESFHTVRTDIEIAETKETLSELLNTKL